MCQLREELCEPAAPVQLAPPHRYWVIAGQAYDLDAFVKHHPGGDDAIRLGRGRDCTELFEQYHVLNTKHLRVLERYRVALPPLKDDPSACSSGGGGLLVNGIDDAGADAAAVVGLAQAASTPRAHQTDPFYEDIKTMVREHQHTKMSRAFVILHCLHVFVMAYTMKLWWEGSIASAVLLPFILWVFCAALVHDGGHFAISRSATVNKYLNLTMALITNSTGCWHLQHNILHHSYTNLTGKDGDLDSHHPYMRIHPEQVIPPTTVSHVLRLAGHLAMYLLAHIGLTLFAPVTYFRGLMARRAGTAVDAKTAQDLATLDQFRWSIVLQTCTAATFYVTPFLRFPFLHACTLTFLPTFIMSIFFMIIAQVSHIQLDAEAPSADLERLHWARRMALTSVDYSQESYLVSYLTIGLNMQSLHHIIPGVSYSQLTALYPTYRQICARHGIRLLERRSLAHALWTHLQTLWVLSKTHSFAQVAAKLA